MADFSVFVRRGRRNTLILWEEKEPASNKMVYFSVFVRRGGRNTLILWEEKEPASNKMVYFSVFVRRGGRNMLIHGEEKEPASNKMVYFSVFVKRGREHTLEKDGRTFLSDPRPGKHIIYPRSKSTFIPAIRPHLLKHSSLNYPGNLPVKHLPKTFS